MSGQHHVHDDDFFERLVGLADNLTPGHELLDTAVELVDDCVQTLPVRDAGVMVADQQGMLRVLASSSEETRVLELFELQNHDGPCLDAFSTGKAARGIDLAGAGEAWPVFSPRALALDYRSAYSVPVGVHGHTLGAVNLFCSTVDCLDDDDLRAAHQMATMAALGILNHRTMRQHEVLAQQLQRALDVRVVVEQAKGMVAASAGVALSDAFSLIRSAARATQRPLAEVAHEVTAGKLRAADLVALGRPGSAPGRR
jgi:hypothetical protein